MIELLNLTEWYGISKNIDIAKGINQIPTNIKQGIDQIKRQSAWQLKK